MKKFFLSMLMAVSFLGFTATAGAWHFEVNYYGDGCFDSGPGYFHLDDGVAVMADAGWHATPWEDTVTGEIWVDYNVYSGGSDSYDSTGHVEFQIVSDFGNPDSQLVDVWFHGDADTYEWVDRMGNPTGLDGGTMADVHVDGNFGFMLEPWNNFDELIELDSNMWYGINTEIWMEAWAMADQPGPDCFESWDAYNAWCMDGDWGEIMAECNGSFGFNADIITAEVPIPGAVWLLGSGLLGLIGFRRKQKS